MDEKYRSGRLRVLLVAAAFIALAALLAGCTSDSASGPGNPNGNLTAWVINSLAETLGSVDLVTGNVDTDALLLNSIPNDIVIDGNIAYVVNSGSNNVQIIDLSGLMTVGTIEILQGVNPYYICMDGQGRAFVSNLVTGNVSVLDLATETETSTIATGGMPEGVCVSGDYLYVTDINDYTGTLPGKVYQYDLAMLTLQATTIVGINPQVVKMGPDGNLHVVCTGDYGPTEGQVDIVDPATMTVLETIAIGGLPGSLGFTSTGIAYLGGGGWSGDGTVLSYDAITHDVIHDSQNPIPVPSPALGVAITGDDRVLVSCFNSDEVVELNAEGVLLRTFQLGDGPLALAVQTP